MGIIIPLVGIVATVAVNRSAPGESAATHSTASSAPINPGPDISAFSGTPSGSSATVYGKQLLHQRGIDLPRGMSVSFSDKPMRPSDVNSGEVSYDLGAGGPVHPIPEWNAALLTPDQPRSYQTCRDDTRYSEEAGIVGFFSDQLPAGGAFCMTNPGSGHIALVQVTHRSSASESSDYVTLDITIWQGPVRTP